MDILEAEGCCISKLTAKRTTFGKEALDKMTNCHTRWNGMRVYNQIRNNTFSCEWQVFLSVCHTASTFLTVTRCKLISDLWGLDSSHLDFNEKIVFFILGDHDCINLSCLRVS